MPFWCNSFAPTATVAYGSSNFKTVFMTLDVFHPTCVKIIVVQQLLKNRDNEIEAVPRKSSLILGVPSRA